jgi:hypothetical protein
MYVSAVVCLVCLGTSFDFFVFIFFLRTHPLTFFPSLGHNPTGNEKEIWAAEIGGNVRVNGMFEGIAIRSC